MKRILVPTDFSACALDALKVAAKLATQTGATIDLVHIDKNSSDEKMKQLEELTHLDFLKDVTTDKHVLANSNHLVELNLAKKTDLIVMGTHGTTNWKEDAKGSNAAQIILSAKVPVLVTKVGQQLNLNDIVFASSFDAESEKPFQILKSLLQLPNSTLHLLFVIQPSFFSTTAAAEGKMEEFAKKMKLENYTINVYNDKTVEDGIHNFSKKINADLITMETHGRSGLAHFFSGSIAEDVVNHAELPVLCIRIKTVN